MATWGIGTGRSGTMTLARTCYGLHEPRPWFFEEATRYYRGERDEGLMKILRMKIAQKLRSPCDFIVDQKLSLIIPLLVEMDPDPYFIWLVREPVEAVKSYMGFGYYRREHEEWDPERVIQDKWRPSPKEGWPEGFSYEAKCFWYWYECNRVIEKDLRRTGAPFDLIFTHELGPVKYNTNKMVLKMQKGVPFQQFRPKPDDVLVNRSATRFYKKYVKPFWEDIIGSRSREVRA